MFVELGHSEVFDCIFLSNSPALPFAPLGLRALSLSFSLPRVRGLAVSFFHLFFIFSRSPFTLYSRGRSVSSLEHAGTDFILHFYEGRKEGRENVEERREGRAVGAGGG